MVQSRHWALARPPGHCRPGVVLFSSPRTSHWFCSVDYSERTGAGTVPAPAHKVVLSNRFQWLVCNSSAMAPCRACHSSKAPVRWHEHRAAIPSPGRPVTQRCLISGLICPGMAGFLSTGHGRRRRLTRRRWESSFGKKLQMALQFFRIYRKRNSACCCWLDADLVCDRQRA